MKNSVKLLFIYLILLALIAGGYSLFIWFVVTVMKGGAVFGLLFVAIVAGTASFFNPCAFPLIPAYLAQYYTTAEENGDLNKKRILFSGLAAALGVITFNILLGSLIGLLGIGFGKSLSLSGSDPSVIVRWVRGVVGGLLILLGISQFTGRGINLHFLQPDLKKDEEGAPKKPFRKMFTYGFLFTLLGIGCGGPILAGLSVYALSQGGFLHALLAFLIYSAAMALLMILISVLIAFSKQTLIQNLRKSLVSIKRGSGILLFLVGIFLVLSSIYVSTFTRILFP